MATRVSPIRDTAHDIRMSKTQIATRLGISFYPRGTIIDASRIRSTLNTLKDQSAICKAEMESWVSRLSAASCVRDADRPKVQKKIESIFARLVDLESAALVVEDSIKKVSGCPEIKKGWAQEIEEIKAALPGSDCKTALDTEMRRIVRLSEWSKSLDEEVVKAVRLAVNIQELMRTSHPENASRFWQTHAAYKAQADDLNGRVFSLVKNVEDVQDKPSREMIDKGYHDISTFVVDCLYKELKSASEAMAEKIALQVESQNKAKAKQISLLLDHLNLGMKELRERSSSGGFVEFGEVAAIEGQLDASYAELQALPSDIRPADIDSRLAAFREEIQAFKAQVVLQRQSAAVDESVLQVEVLILEARDALAEIDRIPLSDKIEKASAYAHTSEEIQQKNQALMSLVADETQLVTRYNELEKAIKTLGGVRDPRFDVLQAHNFEKADNLLLEIRAMQGELVKRIAERLTKKQETFGSNYSALLREIQMLNCVSKGREFLRDEDFLVMENIRRILVTLQWKPHHQGNVLFRQIENWPLFYQNIVVKRFTDRLDALIEQITRERAAGTVTDTLLAGGMFNLFHSGLESLPVDLRASLVIPPSLRYMYDHKDRLMAYDASALLRTIEAAVSVMSANITAGTAHDMDIARQLAQICRLGSETLPEEVKARLVLPEVLNILYHDRDHIFNEATSTVHPAITDSNAHAILHEVLDLKEAVLTALIGQVHASVTESKDRIVEELRELKANFATALDAFSQYKPGRAA